MKTQSDHSIFYRHSKERRIILVVYVDDIVITGDAICITQLKSYLHSQIQTKDLGFLKYFLEIEIARFEHGIYMCRIFYVPDILEKTKLLESKPVDTPMDPNVRLAPRKGKPFLDPGQYQ